MQSTDVCNFSDPVRLRAVVEADITGDEDGDGLSALDDLLATYARQQEEEAARWRAVFLDRQRFVHVAACTFERVVRPTFQSIAERLDKHGGGGLVAERPAQGTHGQRLTLWMSLDGPVGVPARVDRNPYIQLDVDVLNRNVDVWEGDMWNKRGASHRGDPVALEQLTSEKVIRRAIRVLGRTVANGGAITLEAP